MLVFSVNPHRVRRCLPRPMRNCFGSQIFAMDVLKFGLFNEGTTTAKLVKLSFEWK